MTGRRKFRTVARYAFFVVFGFICIAASAEQHTLTDVKGRKITVTILKADSKYVWVKLANRKEAKIPRSQLIEANQQTIDEWLKSALPDIRVDAKVARGNKRAAPEFVQNLQLTVNLENKDRNLGIDDVEVEVWLVGRGQWDKSYFAILWKESASIEISADDSETITFSKLINTYTDSWGYHAMNYVVHVRRGEDDRLIYLGSDDGVLDKRAEDIIKLNRGDVVKGDWTQALKSSSKYAPRIRGAN
ncbi:hypothetical protein OAH21_01570 [bacterium]|nr:hypothetical protein [bacterium]